MNPVGKYETFESELIKNYSGYMDGEIVSFGILLVDYRQSLAREYIINYLKDYHLKSGKSFNFFIPGYFEEKYACCYKNEKWYRHDSFIDVDINIYDNDSSFFFCYELFRNFYVNLENKFGIKYNYTPMLILMSMRKSYPGTAKYIVIELESLQGGVKKSGEFFNRIFEAAARDWSVENLENCCYNMYIRNNIIDVIINALGQAWIEPIRNLASEYRRYRIRK